MISFAKFHGFGNDYIVIEKGHVFDSDLAGFARAVCLRHTGAGADGVAVLEKLDGRSADYFCEIVNPDGGAVGFSGNGTRCAASYLYRLGLWEKPDLRLATRSGIKNFRLLKAETLSHFVFEAEIGTPKFSGAEIPFTETGKESILDREIDIGPETLLVSCVNVGNPVACVFVDSFDFEWPAAGRSLETHENFPERTNVAFVKILDSENIEIRIWERGAGETAASGTCSSGAAVLAAYTGRTGRKLSVKSLGGVTGVDWREDGTIVLTGSADFVYSGQWPLAAAP